MKRIPCPGCPSCIEAGWKVTLSWVLDWKAVADAVVVLGIDRLTTGDVS